MADFMSTSYDEIKCLRKKTGYGSFLGHQINPYMMEGICQYSLTFKDA